MEEHLKTCYPFLKNYTKGLVKTTVLEWEDILQEALLRIVKYYKSYDPSKSKFQTWASKIIFYHFLEEKKKIIHTDEYEEIYINERNPKPNDIILIKELQKKIKYKYVWDVYMNTQQPIETARKFGVSHQAVNQSITRARNKLKELDISYEH